MKKYSERVLDYKKAFKNTSDLIESTDKIFKNRYFSEFSTDKETSIFYPPFVPGQIYSFRYLTNSKINQKRDFINRNPIILFIEKIKDDKYGEVLRGLDLITVPPIDKIEILSLLFDEFHSILEKNEARYKKNQSIEPLPQRDINKILNKTGAKNSVFGFKKDFIRDINVLILEDWFKIPYLRFAVTEGLDVQGIYKKYPRN